MPDAAGHAGVELQLHRPGRRVARRAPVHERDPALAHVVVDGVAGAHQPLPAEQPQRVVGERLRHRLARELERVRLVALGVDDEQGARLGQEREVVRVRGQHARVEREGHDLAVAHAHDLVLAEQQRAAVREAFDRQPAPVERERQLGHDPLDDGLALARPEVVCRQRRRHRTAEVLHAQMPVQPPQARSLEHPQPVVGRRRDVERRERERPAQLGRRSAAVEVEQQQPGQRRRADHEVVVLGHREAGEPRRRRRPFGLGGREVALRRRRRRDRPVARRRARAGAQQPDLGRVVADREPVPEAIARSAAPGGGREVAAAARRREAELFALQDHRRARAVPLEPGRLAELPVGLAQAQLVWRPVDVHLSTPRGRRERAACAAARRRTGRRRRGPTRATAGRPARPRSRPGAGAAGRLISTRSRGAPEASVSSVSKTLATPSTLRRLRPQLEPLDGRRERPAVARPASAAAATGTSRMRALDRLAHRRHVRAPGPTSMPIETQIVDVLGAAHVHLGRSPAGAVQVRADRVEEAARRAPARRGGRVVARDDHHGHARPAARVRAARGEARQHVDAPDVDARACARDRLRSPRPRHEPVAVAQEARDLALGLVDGRRLGAAPGADRVGDLQPGGQRRARWRSRRPHVPPARRRRSRSRRDQARRPAGRAPWMPSPKRISPGSRSSAKTSADRRAAGPCRRRAAGAADRDLGRGVEQVVEPGPGLAVDGQGERLRGAPGVLASVEAWSGSPVPRATSSCGTRARWLDDRRVDARPAQRHAAWPASPSPPGAAADPQPGDDPRRRRRPRPRAGSRRRRPRRARGPAHRLSCSAAGSVDLRRAPARRARRLLAADVEQRGSARSGRRDRPASGSASRQLEAQPQRAAGRSVAPPGASTRPPRRSSRARRRGSAIRPASCRRVASTAPACAPSAPATACGPPCRVAEVDGASGHVTAPSRRAAAARRRPRSRRRAAV